MVGPQQSLDDPPHRGRDDTLELVHGRRISLPLAEADVSNVKRV